MKEIKADVLIMGGGIAGSAFAFMLARDNYPGSVILVEKEKLGSQRAYGYRNTLVPIVEKYDIPYVKKFRGIRDGVKLNKKITWLDVPCEFCFFDYGEACESFIDRSCAKVIYGTALELNLDSNSIQFDFGQVFYKYLIDCTGYAAWSRSKIKLPKPQQFYVGITFQIPMSDVLRWPKVFEPDWFAYYSEENGYMEDFYQVGDIACFGYWKYSNVPIANLSMNKNGIISQFQFAKDIHCYSFKPAIISADPVYPIHYGNIAFLGDSISQSTPASSEGTRPILNAAETLSKIIIEGGNLTEYQKIWVKENFMNNVFQKAFKEDLKGFNRFFIRIRKDLKLYKSLILNEFKLPKLTTIIPSIPFFTTLVFRAFRELYLKRKQLKIKKHL